MPKVFSAIARLIYYSNGGFSFQELYQGMPVYVRRYMTGEIEDIKKKEKEAMQEGKSSSGGQAPPEDIGKAMEQLEKDSDGEGLDEEDVKQVFGDKEEREKQPQRPKRNPQKTQQQRPSQTDEQPEKKRADPEPKEQKTSDDVDPAKAEDLEQMLDVLGE